MDDRARLQRRTLRVLVAAQVFGGAGFFLGIAVAALLARDVSGSDALAGLPLALGVIAAALAAAPIAGWMARAGRRPGLVAGQLCAATGAAVVVVAAGIGSFPLLCLGMAAFGVGNTANLLARYAATDLAPPERRARAISTILLATAAGAIVGPNLAAGTEPVAEAFGVPDSAGPYAVAVAAYLVAAAIVAALLRPDPLLASLAHTASGAPAGAVAAGSASAGSALGGGRSAERPPPSAVATLLDLPSWPRPALVGVGAMATVSVAMIAVMTMTPVHMEDAGESLSAVGLVISLHVAGMYLPSPLSGWLADRVGRLPVVAAGGVVLVAAGALSAIAPGDHTLLMVLALVLLGVGWNLGLVAGSALVTDAAPPELRAQTQGAADLLMGLCGAAGSLVAGPLFHAGAFGLLGAGAAGLGVLLVVLAARARPARPVEPATP